jgi:hypothetical protein
MQTLSREHVVRAASKYIFSKHLGALYLLKGGWSPPKQGNTLRIQIPRNRDRNSEDMA